MKTATANRSAKTVNRSVKGGDVMPPKDRVTTNKKSKPADFMPRTLFLKAHGKPVEPREGSKRAQVLEQLRHGGVTIEQLCKKHDWKPRDAMDSLRLLAKVNNIPVKQQENGRFVRG